MCFEKIDIIKEKNTNTKNKYALRVIFISNSYFQAIRRKSSIHQTATMFNIGTRIYIGLSDYNII